MGLIKVAFILALIQSFNCHKRGDHSRLNFFDTDLLRYTAEDQKGNIIISPASIRSTLAMLLEGSRETTAEEIRIALRLLPNKDDYREQLHKYLSALHVKTNATELQNMNAVFVSQALKLKPDFEKMLKAIYMTEVNKMDFSNPGKASDQINGWVKNKTNGLIKSIVERVQIKPMSKILLANALYFKNTWKHAFNPRSTKALCFHVDGDCRNVAMMELHAELNYAYVEELRAHALELPYEGEQYSMILLVPQERNGCAALVRDLPYMSLPQISNLLEPSEIYLNLPKFTADFTDDMLRPLKQMKIQSLFTPKANLSGIFEGASPHVSNLFHKVHVSVDEEGTVAAAASAAMVIPLIADGVRINVDRPFVFFIRDNSLGLVLFEGKIEEPTVFIPKPVDKKLNSQPMSAKKPADKNAMRFSDN